MARYIGGNRHASPDGDPRARTWARYVGAKFGVELRASENEVEVEKLVATQHEIELIKYRLVRNEGYRTDEPIVVYRGRMGTWFVVDGHTRARVKWDTGVTTVRAIVLTSSNLDVDLELGRTAAQVGSGDMKHVWEIPVTDRLGEGSEAWQRRRDELLGR